MGAGATMLFLAALLPQALFDDPTEINAARTGLWILALAVDYGGIMILGAEGWQVFSAAHWAERHGLIVIIALGESIVSIGVGVAFLPISWPIIVASVLGIAIAASLWWAYFDVLAIGVERALHRLTGTARASLAIHAYTYLHLPLIAGIIFTSLGMKKVMEYVGDTDHHSLSDPLKGVALYALYGGVMAYFLGEVGIKRRALGTISWIRLGAVVLLGVLIPVVAHVPALAAFAILAAVCVTVVAVETRVLGRRPPRAARRRRRRADRARRRAPGRAGRCPGRAPSRAGRCPGRALSRARKCRRPPMGAGIHEPGVRSRRAEPSYILSISAGEVGLHAAALDLQRRGDLAVLDGQVARQDGELLDRLPAVELGVELLDVAGDHRLAPRARRRSRRRTCPPAGRRRPSP